MRIVFTSVVILISSLGYSQSALDIDNLSHPFQVLFVEDASYIARQEKIQPFEFTNRYGLIRNKGRLVLLHYTGYLYEAEPGLVDIREIAEPLESTDSYVRPPISEEAGDINSWRSERQYHNIKLLYPWKHTIQLSRHERLPIQWYYEGVKSLPKKSEYEITVRDLHDKILLRERTKEHYYEIILDSLHLPENLIICHIGLPDLDELSDDIVIAFEQEHEVQSTLPKHYSVTKYQSFIDGLIAVQKKEFDLATKLFHLAIDTHNDPVFDAMYRKFLDEHPKLKSALE